MAWPLAQQPWMVPIPGSRTLKRLDENNGAVEITLPPRDLQDIDEAMAAITVTGDCYRFAPGGAAGFTLHECLPSLLP